MNGAPTTQDRRRLVLLVSLAVALAIAAVALIVTVGGDGDDGGTAAEIPAGTGFLFIGGEYVEPPYTITVRDLEITINDRVVVSLPDQAVPAPAVSAPPESPETAIDAIDTAGSRFLELGGLTSSEPDPAVVEELRQLLLSFDPIEHVERDGVWLMATDSAGEVAGLLLMAADPIGEEALREDLESRVRA